MFLLENSRLSFVTGLQLMANRGDVRHQLIRNKVIEITESTLRMQHTTEQGGEYNDLMTSLVVGV